MWIRFEATTRRPASSSILVIAPVRLRRVASGLMMEKVRVAAMTGRSPANGLGGIRAPPSRASPRRQASGLLDPLAAFAGPVTPFDPFPPGQQFPGQPSALERGVVEKIKTAVVGQRRFAPRAIGNQQVARLVGSIRTGRQQDRLARV